METAITIKQVYTNLTCMYLERYMNNEDEFIKAVCSVEVPKQILAETYRTMIADRNIKPIEQLPKEEKDSIFEKYKKTGVPLPKEQIITVCSIIHTLDFLSKNV